LFLARCVLIKIRPDAMPALAAQLGFRLTPVSYKNFDTYNAKPGAKLQKPDMTELEALQSLVPKQLIKVCTSRAEAYFARKEVHERFAKEDFWRYWTAVLAHGVVQYATEDDAYVAAKSSVGGLLGNGLLRRLHTREQWQHAKQAWTCTRDVWTKSFNLMAKELWCQHRTVIETNPLAMNSLRY